MGGDTTLQGEGVSRCTKHRCAIRLKVSLILLPSFAREEFKFFSGEGFGERRSSFSTAWKIGTAAEGKPRRDAVVDKLLQLRTFRNFGKAEREPSDRGAAVKTFKFLL